jgi:ATP-dependent DNA helicase RecG
VTPPLESQDLEYKLVWRDDYLKWICGFANAKGGRLFVGVDDDGKVRGLSDARRLLEEIPNKVVSHLGIVVDVALRHEDSLEWLEIRVPRSDIPISWHGVYHYRSGSTRQELKGAALQQFLLRKLGRTWDAHVPERSSLSEIDPTALAFFVHLARKAQRIPDAAEEGDVSESLSHLHLLGDDGRPTHAALVHKDYTGAHIQLSVYDDRLVIWNHGKLPDDLAIIDLKRAHPSKPRNPNIAEIFFKAGFIETWGRGIDKILTSCAQSGLAEPTFEEWAGGVQVTFFRKVTTQVTTQVEAVVKVLEHGETISARELMERLGLANREHFREAYLDAALKAGLIERTLPNKPNSRLQKYRRCGGVA